ncbi:hypothetical protein P12x_005898 [Tundrisphaera lichenicola]
MRTPDIRTHDQKVCFPRNPKCEGCAVLDLCPYGNKRINDHDRA